MTNRITFTDGILAAGGLISGRFEGERFSGTFEITRPRATASPPPSPGRG
jgi:hypothetical protein